MYTDLGDVYTLSFTLLDGTGTPVSADTMVLTIALPDATTETHTVTASPTGVYTYAYTTVQAGRHVASWLGTGTHFGSYAEAFDVHAPSIQSLISLADAKAQLNVQSSNQDDELRTFLEAVTAVVEAVTKTTILRVTRTERQRCVTGLAVLAKAPVITITAAVNADQTLTWNPSTDLNWTADGLVGTNTGVAPLDGPVDFTYVAGTPVVPPNYLLAARFLLQHLWQTKRGNGGPPSPGAIGDETYVPGVPFAVPYKVLELLGNPRSGVA